MKPGQYKTTFKGMEIPLIYVTEKHEADSLIGKILAQPEEVFAIDTETEALPAYRTISQAALSPHLSRVRLIQIFTGRTAIVFDCKKIAQDSIFTRLLEERAWVGHNSVFDLGYFYRWFGIKKCNIGCTYLCAKLIIHATKSSDTGLSASLRNLVNIVFGEEIIKEMQTSDWSVPELTFEQVEYSALDAITTYYLADKLAPKLEKFGLRRIYELYKNAQHAITKMQLNGLKLDVDRHRDLIVGWRADLYKARKELTRITGLSNFTPTSIGKYLERTLPPEVLDIWPRTEADKSKETGRLQTDSNVFADFDYLEIVKPFTEFQKREKLCTAFGNSLIEKVNPATGRLHPSYRLAGARTGRLSCSDPNLQQLPRDYSVRRNFIPESGKVFVCADYSQIEIRVGAELSQDRTMLKAYSEGVDLHELTAQLISHVSKEQWNELSKEKRKELRQKAKAFNFGLMFGLGAKKFSHYAKKSYGAEVSQKEAQEGVETFRQTYSGYREWQLQQSSNAVVQGYVVTPCGKRRCLDRDNSYGPSMNTPVQGGAAECMLYSLVALLPMLDVHCSSAKLVNCVHDEVMVECKPESVQVVIDCIEQAMINGFREVFPGGITRGIAEVKSGANWAEAK